MYHYDSKNNILEISKISIQPKSNVYEVSDSFTSYDKFVKTGILDLVKDVLVPALNKELGGTEDLPEVWYENGTVRYDKTSNYKGYEYNSVFVSLGTRAYYEGTKPFCIFKVPYMDNYGILHRDGTKYIVLNELVQDDDITFSDDELKIMTKARFISIKATKSGPKIKFGKSKHDIFDVMFTLAEEEGLDGKELFDKLRSKNLVNAFKDQSKLIASLEYSPDAIRKVGLVDAYKTRNYSLELVRDKINKVLSIDRALGHSLSRDITLRNGEVIEADTTVTAVILKKLKYNRINEVYVQEVPNMMGYCFAEDFPMTSLRIGTEMLPVIQDLFPDYKGMYLDRSIGLGQTDTLFVIPEGTQVTKGLLELLAFNGADQVRLRKSLNSKVEVTVAFEREIIANRHFKESDLGISNRQKYVYVEEDGTISPAKEYLCTYDLLAMVSLFSNLIKGEDLEYIAGRDIGFRKKVNQANELFTKAFCMAFEDYVRMAKKKLRDMLEHNPQDFNNPDVMEARFYGLTEIWWSKLYSDMRVLQQPDMTNPASFYSSLNKVVSIVADSNAISMGMRRMTMVHYGRICPYETPSSKKLGVVTNKALGCKIIDGIMYTSYYKVVHGKDHYVTSDVVWLKGEEEEVYRIADITSLKLDSTGKILTEGRVLARIPAYGGLEKVSCAPADIAYIDFVNTSPNQTISAVCATIPFQGADDSVRVTFEISMCKQAKSLLSPDVPLVLTSANYDIPRMSPYFQVNAEYDGVVVDAVEGSITVYYYELNDTKTYDFDSKEFTNTSIVVRSVEVKKDQEVKAGDLLVSSNFTKDGLLAMGVNALIAFIPEGYNYEDGVYMSERLKYGLTSYGANSEGEEIAKKYRATAVAFVDKFRYIKPGQKIYKVKHLHKNGYIDKDVRSDKLKGFIVNVVKEVDKFSGKDKETRAYSISFDYLQGGDKLANRHGNKGVVPSVRPNIEMERLNNGEFIDICYNPAGVSSRMNIGQVLEANLGLACLVLGIRSRSDSFNGAGEEDIKELLSYAWHLANIDNTEAIISEFSNLPTELHEHTRNKIEWIKTWKNAFHEDGTADLYNPKTGRYFETPVLIGVNHVYKLVQEIAKKVHARGGYATEPYVEKTDAPPKGASKRGGQRFGPMEIDALSAYGASALIQELMNERGDNAVARNNLTVAAMHKGTKYMVDPQTGIRRSTEFFVNALESLGVHVEFEGELPNNSKLETAKRMTYTAHALITARDVGDTVSNHKSSFEDFCDELGAD